MQRLCVAGALVLFLLPLVPLAPAQSLGDPWWGPSDRSKPTEGFAIRVPVTIENKFDYTLMDPFVAVELDYAQLLVAAGWTNQTVGAELRLRGFTLDVDSIRVVPYNRGFVSGPVDGGVQEPIAHVFYPALLEAPKFRDFDAARSPAGTVMFQLEGSVAPQQKRDFYIYANPLEYGKREPFKHSDPTARGAVDSFLWGSTGTVTYGYEPNQPGQRHLLHIEARHNTGASRVTVSTFELGRYAPLPSSVTYPNPFTLQPGEERMFLVPAGRAYKVESEKPVHVMAAGQQGAIGSAFEAGGYYPGTSGNFADDNFRFWVSAGGRGLYHVVKASPGTVVVNSRDRDTQGPTVTLTNANPSQAFIIGSSNQPSGYATFSSNGGKFLVFAGAFHSGTSAFNSIPFPLRQIPSTNGGPSGTQFFTLVMPDAGYIRVCPEANATVRFVDTASQLQIYPDGPVANTPPASLEAKTFCDEIPVPRTANGGTHHEFYAVPPAVAPFRAFVGSGERPALEDGGPNLTRAPLGPYGGLAGIDYDLYGKVGIFGHYNGTRITIFEEKQRPDGTTFTVNRTRGLQRDEFLPLNPAADGTGRWHVVSTKPVSASSLEDASYRQGDGNGGVIERPVPYLFHIPGRPAMPHVTVGTADYRGPLVDLRSSAPAFLTTGPASPVNYRLDLVNLGRWINGEDLADTYTVSCSAPAGWDIDGCAKEVTLGSRSSERLNIVITPSADDVNVTRSIVVEARSKLGAVATFKISVHVEIRYGVGLWFDVEGGRKTIDPPIGLDPAETHSYTIVLKNTGSTQDSFALTLDDPREGWTQELLLDGEPISDVRLDGGESVLLEFRVKAPNAETAPQNIVSIIAQSASNALAADVVNTATRIRPKVDLELTLEPQTRLAEPNETVLFNITTRNKGNDVFTVIFEQDSILPKGWTASLSVPEITLNPNPGNDPTLNYVLQLRVTPPEGARAGDLASVKLVAEVDTGGGRVPGDEISAVVVVRRVYDLVSPPIADAETFPGETLRFVLPISNQGNGQVSLELLPGAVEAALVTGDGDSTIVADWGVQLEVATLTLDINATGDLPLRLDVPNGTAPGLYNITFTTRLSREAFQNLTIAVQVLPLSRVEFGGASGISLVPGRPMTLGYVARNTGNVEGTFDLRASAPTGWNGAISPATARLAPGESTPVTLSLNATRDAPAADYVVRLEAQSSPAAATPTDLRVRVARPQLFLDSVTSSGDLRAGELVLVSASVGNAGAIDATNVTVALLVDDRVVDRVLLSRVPVGSSAQATLSWVATQRGGDVRIVLDPDQEISLSTREDTEADVVFGSRVPAPGILAVLAVLAALAGLRPGRPKAPKTDASPFGSFGSFGTFGLPERSAVPPERRSAEERQNEGATNVQEGEDA